MTERKKLKLSKVARGIVDGKTNREIAADLGLPPPVDPKKACGSDVTVSRLVNDPAIKSEIQKLQKKLDLGPERHLREIDRGLKNTRPKDHLGYLKELGRINGIGQESTQQPASLVIVNILAAIDEAEKSGILPPIASNAIPMQSDSIDAERET